MKLKSVWMKLTVKIKGNITKNIIFSSILRLQKISTRVQTKEVSVKVKWSHVFYARIYKVGVDKMKAHVEFLGDSWNSSSC